MQDAVGMPFDCHDKRIPICRHLYITIFITMHPLVSETEQKNREWTKKFGLLDWTNFFGPGK